MTATVRHFAIQADNVSRARRFYEAVFGWRFEPWGPPNFYRILGAGIAGALEERHEKLSGTGTRGYHVTVGVDDLRETIRRLEANGAHIVVPPFRIDGVGELVVFEDSEGNQATAMRYEPGMPD